MLPGIVHIFINYLLMWNTVIQLRLVEKAAKPTLNTFSLHWTITIVMVVTLVELASRVANLKFKLNQS